MQISQYKISELIDAYIEMGQDACHDDAEIIDGLLDIFTPEELDELGFGDFIKDYMED